MRLFHLGWALAVFAAPSWTQQYTISTVAGGAPPATPAPGTAVPIGNPVGVATDSAGNAYFTSLNCVFKLDLKGVITRIAGTSRLGYYGDGGAAASAQFNVPEGVAVDSAGNIYVADVHNNRVRRISNGVVTTVAGGGSAIPGDGGPATNAFLFAPNGVAVDAAGNLYIADSGNNRVRMVSASGTITTLAGTGTAGFSGDNGLALNAQLNSPEYVAVDGAGILYISDTGNNRIRRVSPTGTITTLAGNGGAGFSGNNGPAVNAALNGPEGVAVDSAGNVFILDSNNLRVRKVSSTGVITTVAGTGVNGNSGDGGLAISAQLSESYGLAIDSFGNLFIASYNSQSIREVSAGGTISTVAGPGAFLLSNNQAATSTQIAPTGVAVDSSGNFYIADNSRVYKVSPQGIITTIAGTGACCGPGQSNVAAANDNISPQRVSVDLSGNLYITDFYAVVHKVSPNGLITTIAGNGTPGYSGDGAAATSAKLATSPGGMAIDGGGNLYLADTGNNRIRKISAGGTITTVAGSGVAGFAGDGGSPTVAQLNQPQGVALDAQGNLYIADTNNHRIRKVTAGQNGTISTIAGTGSPGGAGDGGPAANAQLQYPEGIALDIQGDIFVADSSNNRVREISTAGTINTIGGNGSYAYAGDCGPGSSAQLANPRDVAIDTGGNLYIADSGNNAVRRLQSPRNPTLLCSVVDAASESILPVSPGKIVVLYGTGMGPSALAIAAPANGVFGSQLSGTSVTFNNVPAPLIYTFAGQLSAIVPYEVANSAVAQVTVSYGGASSTFAVPVAATAPSIFTANGSGIGEAASVNNADSTLNSAGNPVKVGGYIQLYATGEGQTSPAGMDGALAPLTLPLPAPIAPVTATVGGIPATVVYAGAAPGAVAGLMQVNVQIPSGVQTGSSVPVFLQVGSSTTPAGVTIAVAGP